MKITVISASMSDSSSSTALGHRILEEFERLAAEQAGPNFPLEPEWVSLRDLAHPLADTLLTGFAADSVKRAFDSVRDAAGIIAITPTYQASFSGLFKMFIDVVPEGIFNQKPVLLAATGGTGRHSLMIDHTLRPLFSYLGAQLAPTSIYAATQDWGAPGLEKAIGVEENLDERIKRAAGQLWWLTQCHSPENSLSGSVRAERTVSGEPSPHNDAVASFPGFVDFETLLGKNPS